MNPRQSRHQRRCLGHLLSLLAVPLVLAASVLAPTAAAARPAGPDGTTGEAAAASAVTGPPAPAAVVAGQPAAAAAVAARPAAADGGSGQRPSSVSAPASPAFSHRAAHRQVTVGFRTVPAVAGVRIAFGGRVLVTDAAGHASYTGPATTARQTLALLDTTVDTGRRHYRFARWTGQRDPDQAYRPVVHGLLLRADHTVTAAFTVAYPVTARFTDQHGALLDPARITKATVKSSTGRITDLPTRGTTWLDGAVPVHHGGRVELMPVTYSLQSLVYDGAQLADAGRQRFNPATGRTVTLVGPFHDLTVTAHDAVFGGHTGRRADVTGPDGTVRSVRFGPHHTAVLTHLPRGRYRVAVRVPGGVVAEQEFQLSRSRTVDTAVITPLDLSSAAVSLLVMAGGVLLIRRVRTAQRHPGGPDDPAAPGARSGDRAGAGAGRP
ncbi:hypothetical protein [Streptomyces sp. YIM S03343]